MSQKVIDDIMKSSQNSIDLYNRLSSIKSDLSRKYEHHLYYYNKVCDICKATNNLTHELLRIKAEVEKIHRENLLNQNARKITNEIEL